MKWSFRLLTLAGIGIYVHVTFFILLLWIGAGYYMERHDWTDAAIGLLFMGTLFVIIVLHELGHALTAKRFGIRTRDITLLPIGGVARLERMPEDPRQELAVALAGPAVNVFLAVVLFAVLALSGNLGAAADFSWTGAGFLTRLLWVNVGLAVFNLLPAFPMDGGRVLRALLAIRMDYARATNIAAEVGQAMAFAFGLVGLFTNPFLVFIAFFVWMGAAQEANMVQLKSGLGGIPVNQVMITDFRTLQPDEPLSVAAKHLLEGYQQEFPVLDTGGKPVGLLTRRALVTGLDRAGEDAPVRDVMRTDIGVAHPGEMAETAFLRLQNCSCRSLLVVRDERLVGIVTSENVGEFLMIQAALHGESGSRALKILERPAA